jgi:molybdopterin-guanine dinucleotide biosynthesis protein A
LEISGVILAGGKSLRLGRDKLLEKVGATSLLELVISRINPLCKEIIIVTARERTFSQLASRHDIKVVSDILPGQGSLGGIYTGLVESGSLYNLVVAADMPFLNGPLLRYMIEVCDGFDFTLPRIDNMYEPLHAIYSKNCIPHAESILQKGERAIIKLFDYVKVKFIEAGAVERFDPRHLSFFNINTEEDLELAREIIGGNNP